MNGTCSKCGKEGKINRHHITYDPEATTLLCIFCHGIITSINTRYAKWKGRVKLTNDERQFLSAFFMTTEKTILEAILKKKAPATRGTKEVKLISRRPPKQFRKYNPLYREDEEAKIEKMRREHVAKMLEIGE